MNVFLCILSAIGIWALVGLVSIFLYIVVFYKRDRSAGLRYQWTDYLAMLILGVAMGPLMSMLLVVTLIKDRK